MHNTDISGGKWKLRRLENKLIWQWCIELKDILISHEESVQAQSNDEEI